MEKTGSDKYFLYKWIAGCKAYIMIILWANRVSCISFLFLTPWNKSNNPLIFSTIVGNGRHCYWRHGIDKWVINYRVTHKGWDFRDNSTAFILPVYLYSLILVSFFSKESLPNHGTIGVEMAYSRFHLTLESSDLNSFTSSLSLILCG